jgi:hypothetical protein
MKSTGDGNLDLDTRLQVQAGLEQVVRRRKLAGLKGTYDLFHDLRGGVQVNKTFVDLELVTVPGF